MEKTIITREKAQSIKNWAWKGPSLEIVFQKIVEAAQNQQDHCILEFRDYNYVLEQKAALKNTNLLLLLQEILIIAVLVVFI